MEKVITGDTPLREFVNLMEHKNFVIPKKLLAQDLFNMSITNIETNHINNFLKWCLSNGYSRNYVYLIRSELYRVFKFAIQQGIEIENVVKKADGYKRVVIPKIGYSLTEINEIINCFRCSSLCNFVVVARNTGLTFKEIVNLKWRNIDFRQKCIDLKKKTNVEIIEEFKKDVHSTVSSGKSRIIPLTDKTVKVLNNEKILQKERLKASENIEKLNDEDLFVFSDNYGLRLTRDYIKKEFKRVENSIYGSNISYSKIRATVIMELLESGANVRTVSSLMGFKKPQSSIGYWSLLDYKNLRVINTGNYHE